jgi:hypothetical protein
MRSVLFMFDVGTEFDAEATSEVWKRLFITMFQTHSSKHFFAPSSIDDSIPPKGLVLPSSC